MSNYPDNMGDDSHLDSDETGNKLSCGCYEEQCECPCEHKDITETKVWQPQNTHGFMYIRYSCNDCDATGLVTHGLIDINWGEEE